MPIHLALYPPDWPAFSAWVRFTRAGSRCECTGECGLHRPRPAPARCREVHGRPALYARGKIILTTAHLCNCAPPCIIPSHVIAACQRCHLRIDRKLHARNAARTRLKKQEKTCSDTTVKP